MELCNQKIYADTIHIPDPDLVNLLNIRLPYSASTFAQYERGLIQIQ